MSVWQQLGAFVYTGANLTGEKVSKFASVGGKWIAPVIYNDDAAGPWNRENFGYLKSEFTRYGIQTWGWFNGNGGDPFADADNIASMYRDYGLGGIILDLELQYQYPQGDANKMPLLASRLRDNLPTAEIGVSTNGMNSSMIWNGRILNPPRSFYDLGIRVLPQWYTAYYDRDGKTPQVQMKFLQEGGASDFNFRDGNAKRTRYRGLPLSYVHPTLEVTGLEGSDLQREINDTIAARKYGYTTGISIYYLESTLDSDFQLLKDMRGRLFL